VTVYSLAAIALGFASFATDSHKLRCRDCQLEDFPKSAETDPGDADGGDGGAEVRHAKTRQVNKLYAYEFLKRIDEHEPIS
jgi:hypothetical protein